MASQPDDTELLLCLGATSALAQWHLYLERCPRYLTEEDFGDSACAGSKLAVSNEAETALFSRAEFADDARKVQCEIPTHI